MKAVVNGKIILPGEILCGKAILFDDKIIDIVDNSEALKLENAEITDAQGDFVSPGLVDIHIHGYMGAEAGEDTKNSVKTMAEAIVKNGVTSFLPTTMTVAKADIETSLRAIRALMKESVSANWQGAQVLGANVEGPFINPSKKGAQAEENILPPDADFPKSFADVIRIITVAPEMDTDFRCIKELKRDTDILISMGHTGADYDTALEGVKAGVGHTTHLFNAMTGLLHRNPGVVGAALGTDVSVEIIADTFHINPGLYSLVYRLKGDKTVLITDCVRASGLADGEYSLGGQKIIVKGIECRLEDGTIAGSVLRLNNAVRNFRDYTGLPLNLAVNAASLSPAKAIGIDRYKGSIEKGKDADIIIADESFAIKSTFVCGRRLF